MYSTKLIKNPLRDLVRADMRIVLILRRFIAQYFSSFLFSRRQGRFLGEGFDRWIFRCVSDNHGSPLYLRMKEIDMSMVFLLTRFRLVR